MTIKRGSSVRVACVRKIKHFPYPNMVKGWIHRRLLKHRKFLEVLPCYWFLTLS